MSTLFLITFPLIAFVSFFPHFFSSLQIFLLFVFTIFFFFFLWLLLTLPFLLFLAISIIFLPSFNHSLSLRLSLLYFNSYPQLFGRVFHSSVTNLLSVSHHSLLPLILNYLDKIFPSFHHFLFSYFSLLHFSGYGRFFPFLSNHSLSTPRRPKWKRRKLY